MSCKPSVTSSSLYSSSLMEPKSRRRLCTTEYRDWEKDVLRDSIQMCSFQGTPGPGQGKGSSHPWAERSLRGPPSPPPMNPFLAGSLATRPVSAEQGAAPSPLGVASKQSFRSP